LRKEQEEEARIFDKMRELRNALHEADSASKSSSRKSVSFERGRERGRGREGEEPPMLINDVNTPDRHSNALHSLRHGQKSLLTPRSLWGVGGVVEAR
jgi:hypothetical protein